MAEALTRPVQPLTVGVLVSFASLIGFAVGLGVWGGTLNRTVAEHEAKIAKLIDQQERSASSMATTNVTLAQIQAQLTYLVRDAQQAQYPQAPGSLP